MTTTKVLLALGDGADAALKRLQEVSQRRRIESVAIKGEGDENDSGFSEEEYDKQPRPPATVTAVDFQRLFQALRKIESLRHLMMDYFANPIPIRALLYLFQGGQSQHTHQIESLELYHIHFLGSLADVLALAEALRANSVCMRVFLSSCNTQNAHITGSLVEAVSSLSNLQEVILEEIDTPGESLARLTRLQHLRNLKLRHIPSCNQSMPMLADGLRRNQSLRSIQIRYALNENAALAFFRMLQDNTSIEAADIDMDCWGGYGQPLGDALKVNQRLEDLELNIYGNDEHLEANAVSIGKSLEDNAFLRRLCVTFQDPLQQEDGDSSLAVKRERMSQAFCGPFDEVMASNVVLGELLIGTVGERVHFGDCVQFCLKLNQAGRKELLAPNEAPRSQWIKTLIANVDDLDVLFYFLSMNPSLTELDKRQSDTGMITEPRYKRLKR